MKALTSDKVKITFVPLKRGQHRLLVKVNGSQIRDSPYTFVVSTPLKLITESTAVITKVEQPRSVIRSQGKLIVTPEKTQSIIEIHFQFQVQEQMKLGCK